jgi:dihydroorotate dehydrogenase electron transfer subunit
MADIFYEQMTVIRQEELCHGIYSLWLQTEKIAAAAKAGQFISLYCQDGSRLLPRPISICEMDRHGDAIRLVYRVAGMGTQEFSALQSGDLLQGMGPLGNGFPTQSQTALLVGGGIGIPPLLQLAKELQCDKQIVLGYQSKLFLEDQFKALGRVTIATEDGSCGTKGNVLDAITKHGLSAAVIYACGPAPMLKGIKQFAAEQQMECYISMEEKMACGIGACLSCVCKTIQTDAHSKVENKRICKEGPVFLAREVEL